MAAEQMGQSESGLPREELAGLELVEVRTGRVLGEVWLLPTGEVLVDQVTAPYATVARVRDVDVWGHLRSVGNGYVTMRAAERLEE